MHYVESNGLNSIGTKLTAMGLLFFVVAILMMDMKHQKASSASGNVLNEASSNQSCQGVINETVKISRNQLAQFLTVPERASKANVQDILLQPYCNLPSMEVTAGVPAERVAYPLEFRQQMWLIVLYEGDEYAGFDLRVQ
jgi:hypothetical protein